MADITNTATAVGSGPSGPSSSAPATASVPVMAGAPAISLAVVQTGITDTNNNGENDTGDKINYAYTITNTGDVTLNNITLTDTGVTVTGGPIASLAPGATDTVTFTGTHTISLPEMLAHGFTDNAKVTGTPVAGAAVSDSKQVSTSLAYTASLSLTVSGAFRTAHPKAGDIVDYTYTVKNTGLSLLTGVVLNDPLFVFNDRTQQNRMIALLDGAAKPGASEFATASIFGKKHASGIVEAANRRLAQKQDFTSGVAPEFGVTRELVRMSGKSGALEAGEKIGFLFKLTNAGDVPLTSIRIDQPDSFAFGSELSLLNPNDTDAASIIYTRDVTAEEVASGEVTSNSYVTWHVRGGENMLALGKGLPLSGIKAYDDFKTASIFPINVGTLAAGQSQSYTEPHTLTQQNVDSGSTSTNATATAVDLGELTLTQTGDTTLPITPEPGIALVKTGTLTPADGVSAKVGDKITYHFAITNTGNVTLSNVTASDPGVTVAGLPIATLAPGVTDNSFTAQYMLTQADIDHGSFQNQATAAGNPPTGAAVTALSDYADQTNHRPTVVTIGSKPVIGLLKQVTRVVDVNNNGRNDVGDQIEYQFTVYNLGNVTLSGITVTDTPNTGVNVTINGGPIASLAPGATSTAITGVYTITQADMDAGHVDNTATAKGKAPDGTEVSHDSDPGVPTQSAPTVTAMVQQPQVALYKKQASFDDTNHDGIIDAGDVLHYSFIVQNTGNVSIDNLRLTDTLSGTTVSGNSNTVTLAPGATDTGTFTATYTVTTADEQAGVVHNSARIDAVQMGAGTAVSATSKSGDPSQSTAGTTDTVIEPTPAIGVVLQVPSYADTNNDGVMNAGDTLTYAVQVRNLSSVAFNNITLVDNGAGLTINGSMTGTLLPHATDTTTFTATHVLTAADLAAGHYDAQGKITAALASGAGSPVTALSDLSDFTQHRATPFVIPANAQVTLYKKQAAVDDVNGDGLVDAGDVIHYSFIVKNTGNVALDTIRLTDALPGATVAGNANSIVLEPDAADTATFTATYTVTATDEAAGAVHNRARIDAVQQGTPTTVSAQSRSGDLTSSADSTTDTVVTPTPGLALLLQVPTYDDTNHDGVVNAGDMLTYKLQVKNMSTVALSNITLSDAASGLSFSGALASLAAGATDTTTFTATHILSVADLLAAHYDAQAKATGTVGTFKPSALSDPADFAQHRVTPYTITPVPGIAATLAFDHFEDGGGNVIAAARAGGFARYKVSLWNTGNVAFDTVTVALNGSFTGTVTGSSAFTLIPGAVDTTHFSLLHQITDAEMLGGAIDSQLLVTGSNMAVGMSANHLSDPEHFNSSAVTVINVTAAPAIAVIKTFTVEDANADGAHDAGDVIHYAFRVVNTGNVDLSNVTLTDAAALQPSPAPVLATLAAGAEDTATFTATHVVTLQEEKNGFYSNQATISARYGTASTILALSDNASLTANPKRATVTPLASAQVAFTKTASRSQVKRGEAVAYTIAAGSLLGPSYQVADIMPPGFAYVGGSAKLNGAPITPVVQGQVLTFNAIAPVNGKISITLTLTASATTSGGKFMNTAKLVNQTNNELTATAQAQVEVMPDATFDCSDIIGRVFDDLNGDGYQQDGEPGLPAVRLATVNGLLITTDKDGRFHVPCAAIPDAAIGSNFIMKLDTRSLPQGYKLTTENPRDVRVTRGKATELNFGAGRIHQVKVDFTGQAFAGGTTVLTPRWASGVGKLVDVMKRQRSQLKLVYHQGTESGELAQARVDTVMALVQQAWARSGQPYPLSVTFDMEAAP